MIKENPCSEVSLGIQDMVTLESFVDTQTELEPEMVEKIANLASQYLQQVEDDAMASMLLPEAVMTKPQPLVTKDTIKQMLDNDDSSYQAHVIGRALLALLDRQTASEAEGGFTSDANGVGFNAMDADGATKTALYYKKRGSLQDWQIEKWTRPERKGSNYPRLSRYHKQLNEIAEAKARKA